MVSPRVLLELMLTGKPISAQRAYELGFVNRIVNDEHVLTGARAMAADIVAGAPLVGAAAKAMVRSATGRSVDEGLRNADAIFASVYESADAREGPLAFKEKRAPRWTGR